MCIHPSIYNRPSLANLFFWVGAISVLVLASQASAVQLPKINLSQVPNWEYRVLKQADHDSILFTQGLIIDGDSFIESSGLYNRSFVRRYRISDNSLEAEYSLPKHVFAEGIAQLGDQLYLLSWQRQFGIRLNAKTLETERKFFYQGQGWGLTTISDQLIMSNGTNQLSWHDAPNFNKVGSINVTANNEPVNHLNALSYGAGFIWANIWLTTVIVAIDPESGAIQGYIDLSKIAHEHTADQRENVLNGLAWDEQQQALWITGKRWTKRYLLHIVPSNNLLSITPTNKP